MSLRAKEYLVGQGEIWMQPINVTTGDTTGPAFWLGNCPALAFGATTEQTTHQESHTGRMSTDLEWETSLEVTLSLTVEDFAAESLALVVRGKYQEITAGTPVVDYALPWTVATNEGFQVPVSANSKEPAVNLSAVTIKDSSGTPLTLELGTNYDVDLVSGLFTVGDLTKDSTGGTITVAQPLKVSYTPGIAQVVSAFAQGDQYYRLIFKGVNKVNPNERVVVTAWKVKVTPAEEFSLISTEVGSYEMSGSILQDATRAEDAVGGQYYSIQKVDVS